MGEETWEDGYRITEAEADEQIKDLLAIQQDHPEWFLIWYAGPDRHPDASDTGHYSDCATHSTPAYPDGPCDCGRL